MSMLEVENLNVSYGDLQVLWDVSLEVEKGELVTLIGPNGAGKTTTLEAISGLHQPDSGKIMLQGENIVGLKSSEIARKGIAHIPEGRQIFAPLTVIQNLKAGAYPKEARKHFDEALTEVYELFPRLKERTSQRAGTLSGGERQMLAIARGLMLRPKVIMLDEPSLGLQPNLVDKVINLVEKLNEEGFTILLVEQNADRALEISDRGYVLENGRIALEGPSEELKAKDHIKKAYLGLH